MQFTKTGIKGWGHTAFGRLDADLDTVIIDVISEALRHADVEGKDIDAVYLGHFNAGFWAQDFTAPLVLQHPSLPRFTPVTRLENACATGSAALHAGAKAIESGEARYVLVVGAEKMTHQSGADVGRLLARASYVEEESQYGSFVDVFGYIAREYESRFGDAAEARALIAAKNHANGVRNPYAHLRKAFGADFCRQPSENNPMVSQPLLRSDCSPVSDGAAAVVLAPRSDSKVAINTLSQATDYMPMSRRNMSELAGCRHAWQQALSHSGWKLDDLDLVETHDCFTIAELMQYEAMGLTNAGEGINALQEGWVYADGKLPINVSGGLKSKGHPIGATGVSMHVMAARQLVGEAGEMQLSNAQRAGVFNMGGTGVANYVSLLDVIE